MKRFLLGVGCLVVLCVGASAESSVWKAQKDGSVFYLGATCHILRESDFPLPPEFETAYKAADLVVFETDISKLQDPAAQQALLAKARYPAGDGVEKHLSAEVYAELSAYCVSNGIPLQALRPFKPSVLMVTLTVMELMKLGVTQQGVDLYFHKKAVADGKGVEGLETVDQQVQYVVTLSDGVEDAFVRYSLADMATVRQQFDALVKAWRSGDADALHALVVADLKVKMPALYRKLVTARTMSWMPAVEGFQKTPRTEFILVGAAHLVGPEGLVDLLRAKGYAVEKL